MPPFGGGVVFAPTSGPEHARVRLLGNPTSPTAARGRVKSPAAPKPRTLRRDKLLRSASDIETPIAPLIYVQQGSAPSIAPLVVIPQAGDGPML